MEQKQSPVIAETPRILSPEAQRALSEAEERRKFLNAQGQKPSAEIGGRTGPEPTRYGDWETGGITSDF